MWELDHKEGWAPKNWCFWTVVLEKSLESPLDSKEIKPLSPKGNQSWIFLGRIDAEAGTPILWLPDEKSWLIWKKPWCWERLRAGGEGDNRGWDGWMASLTQWTWVWVDFGSWWWTGKPGVLQFMGSQRVRHDWVTELNWTDRHSWKRIFTKLAWLKSITENWYRFQGHLNIQFHQIINPHRRMCHLYMAGRVICI